MNTNKATLAAMGQGLKPSINGASQTAAADLSAGTAELQQVAAPVESTQVNLGQMTESEDDTYENTFVNSTGQTQNIALSGLFGGGGQYQFFNRTPSAVDFASFTAPGDNTPSNGGTLQSVSYRAHSMAIIYKEIWVQSNTSLQGTLNIKIGKVTKSLDYQEVTKYAPLCDACDNNNTTVFTKKFTGVFSVGMQTYVIIPIVSHTSGQYTTVRLVAMAEHQAPSLRAQQTF